MNSSMRLKSKLAAGPTRGRMRTSTRGTWALIISRSMELTIRPMIWSRWGSISASAGSSSPATLEPTTSRSPAPRRTLAGMGLTTAPSIQRRPSRGQAFPAQRRAAGAGHGVDHDAGLPQHPQHAEVGQGLRPAAGQGQAQRLAGDPAGDPLERLPAAVTPEHDVARAGAAHPARGGAEGGHVL